MGMYFELIDKKGPLVRQVYPRVNQFTNYRHQNSNTVFNHQTWFNSTILGEFHLKLDFFLWNLKSEIKLFNLSCGGKSCLQGLFFSETSLQQLLLFHHLWKTLKWDYVQCLFSAL